MAFDLAFVSPRSTPFVTRFISALRTLITTFTTENPLVWGFLGGKNRRADVEGPFYMLNAPSVEFTQGKAIMAPLNLLKKYRPFLMSIRVLSPEGRPLKGATIDWWQADTEGSYYFASYTLRGTVTTDENGIAEVISVPPGVYGALGRVRAGHFHVKINPPKARKGEATLEDLTTQIYVCEKNDVKILKEDFVNMMRKLRVDNMVQAWSSPSKDIDDGRPYMNFPELPKDSVTWERVWWYNERFEQSGLPGLKVAAGASTEISLLPKGWL